MTILISDDILQAQNLDERSLRIEVAVILYDREILSLGLAAQMANLDRMQFQQALSERNVPIKYRSEDLMLDLQTLRQLKLYGGN